MARGMNEVRTIQAWEYWTVCNPDWWPKTFKWLQAHRSVGISSTDLERLQWLEDHDRPVTL